MLKNATSQEVTGHHAYGHIHATALNSNNGVSMLINGVDTEHMVVKDSNATFTSVKTFQNLTVAETLNAGLVNGVCIQTLFISWYIARSILTVVELPLDLHRLI